MKKNLKERITSLGLNYAREITIIVLIVTIPLIAGGLIYFFLKELMFAVMVGIGGFLGAFFYISRYGTLEKKLEKDHVDELISLLSYFEMFISNGNNVYTSFKMLIPYCSTFMEEELTSLLNHIDQDKTVGPYINFAYKFKNHVVESLMLSIYQMVDNGENTSEFSEFELLFSNIKSRFMDDLVEEKKRGLDSLNSFPLIGAGFITIVLSMCVIQLIGDYINVI